ncbi:DUF3152 domain-containing protein [Kutzneria kofuensis]|uniref:DUF3152 domain-containing protein n=1 Tax=Kutzneria kofuensis TaxID=103725 RepID=A0A7W9KFC7_9PSEU|nr:DUF3152 domain-containing protein [Kutzneria kofuensis]MBB5891602.1 hypothetical protein [Kutzneria kofuensis]
MTRTTQEGRGSEDSPAKPTPSNVSPIRPAVTRRPPEERYRAGGRRTAAQPLTASWRPERSGEDKGDKAGKPRKGVKGFAATYGWRVYALPVLVVVTALVVFNVARTPSSDTSGVDGLAAQNPVSTTTGPPVATENSAVPVDPKTGTAVLPQGDPFPQAGSGTWHLVPGSGQKVGSGPHLYHYAIAVEDGIDQSAYGGDDAYAKTVENILSDPRSWIGSGTLSLQRVGPEFKNPDFIVSLTTPNTDHRPDMCGYQIQFEASCWNPNYKRVVINLARWIRGAMAFNGDIGLYREYAINHEVGHVFGNPHVGCGTEGGLAPVMMQQTFGVSDDYVWQLNQADPSNRTAVAKDGKVCRPNAWPNPQGAPGGQSNQ